MRALRLLLFAACASVFATLVIGSAGATQRYLELLPPNTSNVAFSADSSKVFFNTSAQLVPGDTDSQLDVYEQSNGQYTLVSTGPAGGNGAFDAGLSGISADGSHAVFSTREPLIATDADTSPDLYVWSAAQTALVTQEPSAAYNFTSPGPGLAFALNLMAISDDGSSIYFDQALFQSFSPQTYFRYTSGQTSLAAGNLGPLPGFCGASSDGTHIVVRTNTPLVAADTDHGGFLGAYFDVYEIANGQATLISTGPAATNAAVDAGCAGMSKDGSHVFFTTVESLVPEDTDTAVDVYDSSGGQASLVSTGQSGGNGPSDAAIGGVSDDGSHVFFTSFDQLVPGDTDDQRDVYERFGGQTILVSQGPASSGGAFDSSFVGVSADGMRAYFETDQQLVTSDTDNQVDVYERSGGQTRIATVGPTGGNGPFDESAGQTVIPSTGNLLFATLERLVATDTDDSQDIYEWDGTHVSAVSPGSGPFDVSLGPYSRDGSRVTIVTAEPLTTDDNNDQYDTYFANAVPGDSGGGPVAAGGTVSTGSTASPSDPLETDVTSPSGGTVTIVEGEASGSTAGFQLLGLQAQINASVSPSPTASNPLTIVFELDGSLLAPAGLDYTNVQVLKDGVQVHACTTSTPANPDPCISQRASLPGGGARVTVRTSSASTWTFAKQLQPTDTTGPVVTPSVVGLAGSAGWYRGNVTVSFSVSDPESTVSSTTGCDTTVLMTDSAGTTYTCSATSGGGTTTKSVTVKRDATVPTVTFGSHPASYTIDQTVTISCSATDNLSGIASTCAAIGGPASSFPIGSNTPSSSATDNAGNTGTGSSAFTVQVTPTSLCQLTKQFVQSSAKYGSLKTAQRAATDALVNALCQSLNSITTKLTAKQKAALVVAYKSGVAALVQPGWLTQTQASTLSGAADHL